MALGGTFNMGNQSKKQIRTVPWLQNGSDLLVLSIGYKKDIPRFCDRI